MLLFSKLGIVAKGPSISRGFFRPLSKIMEAGYNGFKYALLIARSRTPLVGNNCRRTNILEVGPGQIETGENDRRAGLKNGQWKIVHIHVSNV